MADDVYISYDELSAVDDALKAIVTELKEAEHRQDELKDALGRPFGKNELHDLAHDFEGKWDDRRNKLHDDIEKVQKHMDAVLKGFQKWDKDAAEKTSETK